MLGYKNIRQIVTTYLVILVVSVAMFLVRLSKFEALGWDFHVTIFWVSLAVSVVSWESLRWANRYLNRHMPFDDDITRRIVVQLAVGVIEGLIIRFIIHYFGEPYLPFKLDSLFVAATWAMYILMPSLVNLGFFTAYFMGRWKDSLVEAERLEKEKAQIQFDHLKNQLNPHFLFNALTSLNSLIMEDQQLASRFLQQLSKVYRYVLQNQDHHHVSLQTELDFIDHYVNLLLTRFRQALTITFDIREEARGRAIVPLTLQILIENAIKHNIVDVQRPLSVEIVSIGDYLVVSNNLQLRKRVESSNKMGLEKLKSFYTFLTDKPVMVEQTADRFYVRIPLI